MAKANKKAQQEKNIEAGFKELIDTFDQIADKTETTMPLLTSSMRHSVQIVKLYREAYYATKDKQD